MAAWLAGRLEASLSKTNTAVKIRYPREELDAFAEAMAGDLDQFLIGHFHRDETIPAGGRQDFLRIAPDWLSRRKVLRMNPEGRITSLDFSS